MSLKYWNKSLNLYYKFMDRVTEDFLCRSNFLDLAEVKVWKFQDHISFEGKISLRQFKCRVAESPFYTTGLNRVNMNVAYFSWSSISCDDLSLRYSRLIATDLQDDTTCLEISIINPVWGGGGGPNICFLERERESKLCLSWKCLWNSSIVSGDMDNFSFSVNYFQWFFGKFDNSLLQKNWN